MLATEKWSACAVRSLLVATSGIEHEQELDFLTVYSSIYS